MNQHFNKGILVTSLGSFWWGFIGVIYFEYVAFIGHIELVVHRCVWTAVMLFITTFFFKKWNIFFDLILQKKKTFLSFHIRLINFYKLGYLDLCSSNRKNY